jgi:hypothetical protein
MLEVLIDFKVERHFDVPLQKVETLADPLPSGLSPTRYKDTMAVVSTCVKIRWIVKTLQILCLLD